jgi:dolichol-phosphate mannosyltransferase
LVELAIVVPTYNERANVAELVRRLEGVLAGLSWEVVFVDDDSPDDTATVVRSLARKRAHVRGILRIGRRGLSRAVVEGVLSTSAPLLAVMDADLQHDESLLPRMLALLHDDARVDVVVGSRYVAGGEAASLGHERLRMSRWANRLAGLTLDVELADPMSGYFVIRREAFDAAVHRLSGEGYKVLLDILASSARPLRVVELPYRFRARHAGESKLDTAVKWEYLLLLLDKRVGRIVPARFVMFAAVGASGVLVHVAVLWVLFRGLSTDFGVAQGTATLVAMTTNYALNNLLTYRDRRHRGLGWLGGLLSFYAICGLGVVANVGVANAMFERQEGWLLAAAAGALVGTVWNYIATSAVTWRRQ